MKTISKKLFTIAVLATVTLFCGMFLWMTAVPAYAEENKAVVVEMKTGASVRYKSAGEETDYSGMRFTAYIDEEYKEKNSEAEYGMLMIPEKLLKGELSAMTENVVNTQIENWAVSDREGYAMFCAVLYDIPETEYGTNIMAISRLNQIIFSSVATRGRMPENVQKKTSLQMKHQRF